MDVVTFEGNSRPGVGPFLPSARLKFGGKVYEVERASVNTPTATRTEVSAELVELLPGHTV